MVRPEANTDRRASRDELTSIIEFVVSFGFGKMTEFPIDAEGVWMSKISKGGSTARNMEYRVLEQRTIAFCFWCISHPHNDRRVTEDLA